MKSTRRTRRTPSTAERVLRQLGRIERQLGQLGELGDLSPQQAGRVLAIRAGLHGARMVARTWAEADQAEHDARQREAVRAHLDELAALANTPDRW